MKKLFLLFVAVASGICFFSAKAQMTVKADVKNLDLSVLWESGQKMLTDDENDNLYLPEPLGYIGDRYQRFHIHLTSVVKDLKDDHRYLVFGKTRVKDNVCHFQGYIEIESAKKYVEEEIKGHEQGVVLGKYAFYEDRKQKGAGHFSGSFTSDYILDSANTLYYNAVWLLADGYENNQFEGRWTSYATGNWKVCNWGDFRIPNSGDLDDGAAEFMPSEKYNKVGWGNYMKEHGDTPEGKYAREWWK